MVKNKFIGCLSLGGWGWGGPVVAAEDVGGVAVVGDGFGILGLLELARGGEAAGGVEGLVVGGVAVEFPEVDVGGVDDGVAGGGAFGSIEFPGDGAYGVGRDRAVDECYFAVGESRVRCGIGRCCSRLAPRRRCSGGK